MARTVDDSERINVIESTTVDSTSHDNPTLKIQIPKLDGVSFNFESESEVIVVIQESCFNRKPVLYPSGIKGKVCFTKMSTNSVCSHHSI